MTATFGSVRLFYEIARRSLARHFTYRAAALAGLATNLFFGVLRASVLLALAAQGGDTGGLSNADLVTYTGITQALLVYLSLFGWSDLMQTVYRGEIASDLLRPMSFLGFWMAQDFGRAVAGLVMRGATLLALYALLFGLKTPATPLAWAATALSLLLAWLVSFGFRFLVNLAAFWTPDARGVLRFVFVLAIFGSGQLMPLAFFPEWVRAALLLTPFPHLLQTVVDVWLGRLQGAALAGALLAQLGWAVALLALGQLVLSRATRRLVILGG